MRKLASLLVVPLIVACTAQLTAHESYVIKRIPPNEFKPVVIEQPIFETLGRLEIPTKPPIIQPKATIKEVSPPPIIPKTAIKKFALSLVGAEQFLCLEKLWAKESGWNYRAYNKSSGAYGIPQALPGSKMASAGADWKTNPYTQVKWGVRYVNNRYGSSCGAWRFWQSHHWY